MADRPPIDHELSLKGIVYTGIGLAAILVVAGALMWPLSSGLKSLAEKADPPPPLLPEARRAQEPPGPRLQEDPEGEMAEMLAAEDAVLTGWSWVDDSQERAQIPIERAIELLAEAEAAAAAAPEEAAAEEGE